MFHNSFNNNIISLSSIYGDTISPVPTIHNDFKPKHPIRLLRKNQSPPLSFSHRPSNLKKTFHSFSYLNSNSNNSSLSKSKDKLPLLKYKTRFINKIGFIHKDVMHKTRTVISSRNDNDFKLIKQNIQCNRSDMQSDVNVGERYLKGNELEIFLKNYFKNKSVGRDVKEIVTKELCMVKKNKKNRNVLIRRNLIKSWNNEKEKEKEWKQRNSSYCSKEQNVWMEINRKANVVGLVNDTFCMRNFIENMEKGVGTKKKVFNMYV